MLSVLKEAVERGENGDYEEGQLSNSDFTCCVEHGVGVRKGRNMYGEKRQSNEWCRWKGVDEIYIR